MERNTLMAKCYPRIKDYCREKHGLEFQLTGNPPKKSAEIPSQNTWRRYQSAADCCYVRTELFTSPPPARAIRGTEARRARSQAALRARYAPLYSDRCFEMQ
ncbi:hypothetical protein EVAR_33358_1 [Eumeta japonica]|uniref:Uncharacterized protein n=1 Tax=Eumeta variegata TaxID=151549 RepID=A0A4C1YLS7_EUMVA|nr:hypothetical protein EVAR_33358_1 [Eumeta japonica]